MGERLAEEVRPTTNSIKPSILSCNLFILCTLRFANSHLSIFFLFNKVDRKL